jgi:anti-sigma-K factor RskA
MTLLSEFEVEELLAAYVLNALPPEDAAAVETHLPGCDEHRRVAAELSAAASSLALVVDDQEPPASLRQRVADAVRNDRGARTTTQQAGGAIPSRSQAAARRGLIRPPAQLLAAAAVVVALGVGILVGMRLATPAQQTWTFHGNGLAPQGQATLVYDPSRHAAVLAVTGLPTLAPGQVYEVWLIRGVTPTDVGISAQPNGSAVVRISHDPTQYQTLAITVEPGEQPQPTTQPILAGQLQ